MVTLSRMNRTFSLNGSSNTHRNEKGVCHGWAHCQMLKPTTNLASSAFIKNSFVTSASAPDEKCLLEQFPYIALWCEYGASAIHSCVWTLGPLMAVLFEKFVKEGETFLEEVCHWWWALTFHNPTALPVLSQLLDWWFKVMGQSHVPAAVPSPTL